MSDGPSLTLRCAGCATTVDPLDPAVLLPFRCPTAPRAPNIDHVLGWDPVSAGVVSWPNDTSRNPFIRYRTLQHSYWLARARGLTDVDYVALVTRLDHAVAGVAGIAGIEGRGFGVTPFLPLDGAEAALGVEVWAKNDTGNVAGSHKSRHLFGILLHIEARKTYARSPLAIASCGNAALAAATIAKAVRRPIRVHVPADADPATLHLLTQLGATIDLCARQPADPPGDPCIHRFHESLAHGALPFCVQGSENGLTIDGGATIGHELADQFAMLGSVPDRLFVQVGGGALGSSLVRGLADAVALGVIERLPVVHFVQTEKCAPLARAWRKVADRALHSIGAEATNPNDADTAATLLLPASKGAVEEALLFAASHRNSHMWPWEDTPNSVATGILDAEAYDWLSLVRSMLTTGGWPLVVAEETLHRANALVLAGHAGEPGIEADATGSASLAGAIALHEAGHLQPASRIVATITGVRRSR